MNNLLQFAWLCTEDTGSFFCNGGFGLILFIVYIGIPIAVIVGLFFVIRWYFRFTVNAFKPKKEKPKEKNYWRN